MPQQPNNQAQLEAAMLENARLREEIDRLKAALAEHSIPPPQLQNESVPSPACLPTPADVAHVTAPVEKAAKVALFRSLFRGREDVYAVRWRAKDGTWVYVPAGRKDWQAVLASKPEEMKRVGRETRTLYPLTDTVPAELVWAKFAPELDQNSESMVVDCR